MSLYSNFEADLIPMIYTGMGFGSGEEYIFPYIFCRTVSILSCLRFLRSFPIFLCCNLAVEAVEEHRNRNVALDSS